MLRVLFVLAGLAGLAAPAAAGPPFHEIADEIGLDDAQAAKVRDIVFEHESAAADLDADVRKAELTLHHLLEAETVDRKAAMKAVDALSAAEAKSRRNRIEMALAIREVVSFEQWQRLERMHERSGDRYERRERHERREPRAPRPPDPPRQPDPPPPPPAPRSP